MMNGNPDVLLRLVERIQSVVDKPGGLDARQVADVLRGVRDKDLSRAILAQFLASSCTRGDVSEVFAWATVLSHVEGRRPARDVQREARHVIDLD